MKKVLTALALSMLMVPSGTTAVTASAIERACNGSGRPAANRQLCHCVQRAADMTLTRADQREAARFFRDPQRAQDVRMSSSPRDNEFWRRYRAFAETAEALCN